MSNTKIKKIDSWIVDIPLPTPISFGAINLVSRSYVIVRVTTESGLEGYSYSLSRSAPIDLVVTEVLAPLVVGKDAANLPAILQTCVDATVPLGLGGLIQRGISHIDICLWDINARAQDVPVWKLLEGHGKDAPILIVDGYPMSGENERDFAARLAKRADEGYLGVKITNQGDPEAMAKRLKAVRAAAPDLLLVVDLVWTWRDLKTATAAAELWAQYDLAWIEDPFPHSWTKETMAFHATGAKVASGDEDSDERNFTALIENNGVDVVRLDATTIGGISGFARVHEKALAKGIPVSPHIYPEIHQHCAFAWQGIKAVEMFPSGGPWDFSYQFIRQSEPFSRTKNGLLRAPTTPGLGYDIDLNFVEEKLVRHTVHEN